MNENFKNSFKGFKVKGILIVLGALLVIVLAANAFNSGKGFYIFCGIVAPLTYIAFVIVAILKNRQEIEAQEQAILGKQKAEAEKAAQKKAFEKQIAQLEKERNDAEFALAQEKKTSKELAASLVEAQKAIPNTFNEGKKGTATHTLSGSTSTSSVEPQPKAQPKAKKNNKK